MLDRVLLIITVALVILAAIFAVGAVFVPDFRSGGSAITGVILGALTAGLGSVLTAGYVTREIRRQESDESGEATKKADAKEEEDE